jgi:hypothetical protein
MGSLARRQTIYGKKEEEEKKASKDVVREGFPDHAISLRGELP